MNLRISSEDYLCATLKWSWIINQCLKYVTQQIQQYRELLAEFEEQKYVQYQNVYQQGYTNGPFSRRYQKQYKPMDVSKMFVLFYHPARMDPLSPSLAEPDSLKIHAPAFDPQIDEIQQKLEKKRCHFTCGVKIVNGPDAAFIQCQSCCLPERTETISSLQELSTTATLQCHICPFSPSHLPSCG